MLFQRVIYCNTPDQSGSITPPSQAAYVAVLNLTSGIVSIARGEQTKVPANSPTWPSATYFPQPFDSPASVFTYFVTGAEVGQSFTVLLSDQPILTAPGNVGPLTASIPGQVQSNVVNQIVGTGLNFGIKTQVDVPANTVAGEDIFGNLIQVVPIGQSITSAICQLWAFSDNNTLPNYSGFGFQLYWVSADGSKNFVGAIETTSADGPGSPPSFIDLTSGVYNSGQAGTPLIFNAIKPYVAIGTGSAVSDIVEMWIVLSGQTSPNITSEQSPSYVNQVNNLTTGTVNIPANGQYAIKAPAGTLIRKGNLWLSVTNTGAGSVTFPVAYGPSTSNDAALKLTVAAGATATFMISIVEGLSQYQVAGTTQQTNIATLPPASQYIVVLNNAVLTGTVIWEVEAY